jgi:hypothetical protein
MSTGNGDQEKKIIVDEDWKSQVEAERAAAREKEATEKPTAPPPPLPPANLMFLIGTLYLQGAVALGLLPNPISEKSEVQPEQARHTIDLLTMLSEKTEGNRTPEETEELESALHQLRLAFVSVTKK